MGLQFEIGILSACHEVTFNIQVKENRRLENYRISMNLVKNSKTEVKI